MGHRFAEIAFTPAVRAVQVLQGSRARQEDADEGATHHDRLGAAEAAFIEARDGFFMATVSETGWPYVQHRGGPPGFIRVLDDKTIAFPDFRGNRQYLSVGNLSADDRVSLILVDHARRKRLKLLGRARTVSTEENPAIVAAVSLPDYPARVERAFVIEVIAFDWNCPQHITPRFTLAELTEAVVPLKARIQELEADVARLRAGSAAETD